MRRSYIPENKFVLHPPFPFIFLAIKIVRKRCCYRQPLSTDGVNGPITPLLINEWEKRFQCQPVSWVSPIPCGAARVVQPLGSAQPSAVPGIYPKSFGSGTLRLRAHPEAARRSHAGEPGRGKMLTPNSWAVVEVLSCYPLAMPPQARCFLLGRCWIAQVCSARAAARLAAPWGLELPGPYLDPPLETQPARTPLDFHPGGAQQKPLDTKILGGKKMEAVQMVMPCSFDSLCL